MTSHASFKVDPLLAEASTVGPVLGLETGGAHASLALSWPGGLSGCPLPAGQPHARVLADAVSRLLDQCGLALTDLAAIAVGLGPGSFTGLRVALSYAKGLALAGSCALAGVPSLDALALCAAVAWQPAAEMRLCPLLDARKGEVYAAIYRGQSEGLVRLSEDLVIKPQLLAAQLEEPVLFFGEGARVYARELAAARSGQVAELEAGWTAAEAVAILGAARLARRQIDNARGLEPRYVRPPEAELKRSSASTAAGGEVVWSSEKKRSFTNISMMRS